MATLAAARVAAPAVAERSIRAVHRTCSTEVVRVTVELDREVPFYQERLEGPASVFFDLKGTRTVPSLVDASFRYDSDIVRHIRLGRHPNNTTRVVLDLENVSRFSVFTLYNPYRIVIDAERSAGVLPQPRAPRTLVARSFAPSPQRPSRDWLRSHPLRQPAIVIPNAHVAPVAPNAPVTPVARNARVAPIAPLVLRSRTVQFAQSRPSRPSPEPLLFCRRLPSDAAPLHARCPRSPLRPIAPAR